MIIGILSQMKYGKCIYYNFFRAYIHFIYFGKLCLFSGLQMIPTVFLSIGYKYMIYLKLLTTYSACIYY